MTSVASSLPHSGVPADASPAPGAPHAGSPALADAYAECERIARASSSSFTLAFRLLSHERRQALAALYAYCRIVDDAADESRDPAAALAWWRAELARLREGTPTHPVAVALADAVRRFAVPTQYLTEILTGVEIDLTPRTYETFADLRGYCYHVAAAVGLAALPIFGCRDLRSRAYAEALGIALQLTNILRDVAEDAERGRIYLPREDLRRFGYRERDLHTHVRNDAWRALVAFEVGRTRGFYRAARSSIAARDRRALVAAEGMRLVYQRLLARIAADPDAVFGPRVRVPVSEKALCALAAWVRTRGGAR
ncbi:MAG: presqualene diphosphate synthase HpnD [Deltaproteobacteria bacterium]|nr:presqualene diphosphate synthase HpnD [Deltaproteobacteria bacterium]